MLNKFVGRVLFPNSPAWQQRRLANTAIIVLFITMAFAITLGAAIYWLNTRRN